MHTLVTHKQWFVSEFDHLGQRHPAFVYKHEYDTINCVIAAYEPVMEIDTLAFIA